MIDANTYKPKTLEQELLEFSGNTMLNNKTSLTLKAAADCITRLKKEQEFLHQQYMTVLKNMVEMPIYWADPNWAMEEHIITGIRYDDCYRSDFFDTKETKYQYTPQIVIEVDGNETHKGGDYLAVNLGKNLFFDKEEALQHSKCVSSIER